MRSIWKGHIRFLLVAIPVRIYNAVETSEKIHFNQLHREDYGPIGYDKRCKKCGEVVTTDQITKGYQFAPDQYAIIDAEDIAKVKLKTTKVIDVIGFLDQSEIPATLYDAPYYAGPDGIVAAKPYALLREVLKESGKIGLGKVVLRDREDFVAISPQDDGIVIHKLNYPNEIRNISDVPQLTHDLDLPAKELELARTLIDNMAITIAEIEMRDQYTEALREVIEAKIAGREVAGFVEEEQPVVDIMTALKNSLKQTKRQPMAKAGKAKAAPAKAKTGRKRKLA